MVKTKHILIALAVIGANVLLNMPVHKAFAATSYDYWYGTTDGFVHTCPNPAVVSDVNLTIDDTTCNIDDEQKHANLVSKSIYGGYTTGNDTVSNNSLTIALNSVQVYAEIYAGYSFGGEASGNKLIINSGTINNDVCGGRSERGEVCGNKLIINSGTITGDVYGGRSVYNGYVPGCSGKVSKNEVTINSGTITGEVYGGSSVVDEVSENKLFINNVTIVGNVYGGRTGDVGVASKNEVTINNSTITGEVYGGYTSAFGDAIGNEVTIKNGTISDGPVSGGYSYMGNATNNSITIEGGTFNNVTLHGGSSAPASYGGDATDNSITIEGGTFNNVTLYGGSCGSGKTSSGNTLNLKTVINGTIEEIAKFQNVNFTIPAGMDREMTMLKVTTSMALDGVTFNVQNWSDGDYITLVRGVNGTEGALAGHTNFYILDIGGTKELVYANGMPTARADYTIKQGSVKGESGITGNYTTSILGNTDGTGLATVTGGSLSDTRYSGNELIIRRGNYSFGTAMDGFYGAMSEPGNSAKLNVDNNKVEIFDATITSASIAGCIIGGANFSDGSDENDKGTASNNTVLIHNLTYIGTMAAIMINGGTASINTLGETIKKATVDGNQVKIDNFSAGNAFVLVMGGSNTVGTANDNTVELSAGKYTVVVGGALDNGEAIGNEVTIHGGDYDNTAVAGSYPCVVTGGRGGRKAEENTVLIENGSFNGNIAGGYVVSTVTGDATKNVVTIKDGTFADSDMIYGGYSGNGNANENKVDVGGGTFGETFGIYGGYSLTTGGASKNIVNITNSTMGSGSFVVGGNAVTGDADNNYVKISKSTFAEGQITAGNTVDGDAHDNELVVESGSYDMCPIYGGMTCSGDANNNTVSILNDNDTDGGVMVFGAVAEGGNAKENTVNIGQADGTTTFSKMKFLVLYGGCGGPKSSGNKLNLYTRITMTDDAEVGGFQEMNFTLPKDVAADDTIISGVTSLSVDGEGGEATVNVYAANGVKLNKDDVITLIDSSGTSDTFSGGDVLGGAGEVTMDGDKLILTLLRDFEQKAPEPSAGSEDQQKAPVEGVAAAAVIVNASADLASGQGMSSLLANTAGGTIDTFGAMSAGSSKYKTGSHVDVDGWGVIVGAGKTKEWKNGTATTYGVFFEYGKGDFDTYNGNVHGDGNAENKGVGIMIHHQLANNTYFEGNIRYGKQETEWGERELGSYDTDSKYYGIMVGMGHIFPAGKNEIDVYGRYTFGHVGACDATVGDSHYNFESVKSHRVRLGAKYNFVQEKSNAKPFIGLAWEHEFKGENKASISGVGEAPAPSMKGNTGIMELGCDWDVSKKWTLGLGANAYMGKRKGWDGMARVFYNF